MEELTAHHEAGHALVAIYLGAEVESITIEPDRDDGPARTGDTQVFFRQGKLSRKEFAESSIKIALAGPVAEMIHTGDPFHPALVAEWGLDWKQAWSFAEAIHPDERLRLRYLEKTVAELHRWLRQDHIWAALAAVVDELLAHETLDGEQVREIMETWLD